MTYDNPDDARQPNRIPRGYALRGGRQVSAEYRAYDAPNPQYRPVRVKGTTVSTPRHPDGRYLIWDPDARAPNGAWLRSDVSVSLDANA